MAEDVSAQLITNNGQFFLLPLRMVVGISSNAKEFEVTCPICNFRMLGNPFHFYPYAVIRGTMQVICNGCDSLEFVYLGLDENEEHEVTQLDSPPDASP
ncbi:hypothetical protein C5167_031805 [Papaver somniferum]|uniref:Uncharacterized protein n=1 Tax=Papaver somniferum TaxID=3469 RepID=A0A4Y7K9L8_PAPSO|nr:hypothetical protein C5167_031805 [Papaver somniferum]